MPLDPVASRGYGTCSDEYERARPGYPEAALAALAAQVTPAEDATTVEVGAGTGKLTRPLCDLGRRVVAVEPVEAMRQRLAGVAPDAAVVGATAEQLPLRPRSAGAVVAATAFHWFATDRTVTELARVLRPGGGLALLWNNPDREHDWVDRVWSVVDTCRGNAPRNRDLRWQAPLERSPAFTALAHQRFSHGQMVGPAELVTRIESISFVAALPPAQRAAVLAEVRGIVDHHPAVAGQSNFLLPYRTDLYWCRRR